MSFILNQLEIFELLAQRGSFQAVARKIGKAQSAVSVAIANLEIELGLELFDRSPQLPGLTMPGLVFLEAAKPLLRQSRPLDELANALSLGLESRLDILVDGAVPHYFRESVYGHVTRVRGCK